jgi:hypothetical protein
MQQGQLDPGHLLHLRHTGEDRVDVERAGAANGEPHAL